MARATHPLQRCAHYVPGLRSRPWWRTSDVPEAGVLEDHADAIGDEFDELLLSGRLRLHPQSPGGPRKTLTNGDWNIFELQTKCRPNLGNLVDAPVTAAVLVSIRDAIANPRGLVYFSVLQPGVRVRAHCGPTNTRIRMHLGLRIPPGATIRVGTETRTWEPSRCIVFDDSWEHDAANPSDRPRAVLLVDIWHPDLSAHDRAKLSQGRALAADGQAERGWQGPETAPDYPMLFAALGSPRVARIVQIAQRAREFDVPFVAATAEAALSAVRAEPARWSSRVPLVEDDAIWGELAQLSDRCSDRELVELALICSICWRAQPERTQAMMRFLAAWPVADRAAFAEDLVKLPSVPHVIDALRVRRAPFGALVPALCAAYRTASTPGD